jgi:hypothetical protein
MSILVNADGSPKTYAVVDPQAKTVLATFNWVGAAAKGMEKLKKAGGVDDLMLHNLTHPKCPDWLKEIVTSDVVYCSGKAASFEAQAAGLRNKAATLVAEAEDWGRRAAEWRELAVAASGPEGPGI